MRYEEEDVPRYEVGMVANAMVDEVVVFGTGY